MIIITIKRSLWFALQSFWRNIWLSLATIFIISLTFLSINFLVIINAISDSAIAAVQNKIDVSIYFKQDVRESKVAEVKATLETLSQVKELIYISPDEKLETLSQVKELIYISPAGFHFGHQSQELERLPGNSKSH